jgi:hypothetical protein
MASFAPASSRADNSDDKKTCVASFDRAQRLRAEGKLRDSRDALIECARDTCPALVRRDCTQWMGEVLTSLPSVVIGAQDATGKDLVKVRVSVDGNVVADRLEGKAFAVDPGAHVFRYELPDGTAVEEQVLVREGEKNRALMARFPNAGTAVVPLSVAPLPPQLPPPTPTVRPPEEEPSTQSSPANLIVGLVSGIAGLGALGGSLAFDLMGTSEADALPCGKTHSCSSADTAPASQKYTYADVLLGVGAAAVVLGSVVLIVRPFHSAQANRSVSSLRLNATVLPQGGCRAGLGLSF